MALFSECRLKCAQNMLDIADIVREGIYRQLAKVPSIQLFLAFQDKRWSSLLCLAKFREGSEQFRQRIRFRIGWHFHWCECWLRLAPPPAEDIVHLHNAQACDGILIASVGEFHLIARRGNILLLDALQINSVG